MVLRSRARRQGWTRTELEHACGVSVGTLDAHLDYLVALGLLERDGARFAPSTRQGALARHLRGVLRETEDAPDAPAERLPRRAYGRA